MALLDRFRTARPPWEHPDPGVRAEAVRGLHAQDAALVATILKGDPDVAVRNAALKKIDDVGLLSDIARSDGDASVREEAAGILLRLASESLDAAAALQAAELAADVRQLAALARTARTAAVRDKALERISDEKTLAVVAKTAEDPKVRLHALERLSDPDARADVALKSEHKDVAVAALEGVTDRLRLHEVAGHARAKLAARRARALLDALEPGGRSEPRVAAPAVLREPDETPEERARREAYEHAVDSRRALILRVEGLGGEDVLAHLDEALQAWGRLPSLEANPAEQLRQGFLKAVAVVRERHEQAQKDEQERAHADLEAQKGEREARERSEHEQQQRQNSARLAAICQRASTLAKAEAAALKDVERSMREIRTALLDPGPLQGKHERELLVEKLRQARAGLYPRLQELREADEWKRWANTQVQEELVVKMEALGQAPDLDKAATLLHLLNDRWRQFSQARKQEAEALWLRFKTAREALQARLDEHEKKKAEQEKAHLERKLGLCEQAEALSSSTDWLRTADKVKALQAEWKTLGAAPRKEQKKLWERFHSACDRFFSARKQDLERRKQEWGKNLEKKEALIAQAETLAQSSEWEKAAEEIRKLQAEWKACGPVKKSKSETIWLRFKGACDSFFERYKNRDQIAAQESASVREALLAELHALALSHDAASAPEDLASRIQDLLGRWRQAPALAGPSVAKLNEGFFAARDRLIELFPDGFKGTDLDPEANRAKRAKLVARVEALVQSHSGSAEDSSVPLADRLREALATNAMGGRAAREARWREAAREVEQAEAAWKRIGPVPGEAGRELQARFSRACETFHEKRPR